VPFSPGMLQGSADSSYPHLLPRVTLADGSVLMPLAFFKDVKVDRRGAITTVSWRQDEWDRMGKNDAVPDKRLQVETRYTFAPGHITREDRVVPTGATGPMTIDLEFASFSSGRMADAGSARFNGAGVSRFATQGYGRCTLSPVSDAVHAATTGPMRSLVRCATSVPSAPIVTLRWDLSYNP
jgi:hypothetical protein